MQIILENLTLRNFKGIRDLSIDFSQETSIMGQNEAGKTTVFDAFLYLFFEKDSTDRKDFSIKTLDKNNKPIHKLEHEVSGAILADGNKIELRRILREKWVTKKGSTIPEFNGHETSFFYNDVRLSQTDFQAKINAILQENIFKLITNTTYFNGLKWDARRQILIEMADVSDAEIFEMDSSFQGLKKLLTGKTLVELKAQIARRKKEIKEELDRIPARIDELDRTMPAILDWSNIENKILVNKGSLSEIEKSLNDKTEALKEVQDVQLLIQKDIYTLKSKLARIENDIRQEVEVAEQGEGAVLRNEKQKLDDLAAEYTHLTERITSLNRKIESFQQDRDRLRKEWEETNERDIKFDEHAFYCPTCKRAYEESDIDGKKKEMEANFNADKVKKLKRIQDDGMAAKTMQEECEKSKTSLLEKAKIINENITSVQKGISKIEAGKKTDRPSIESLIQVKLSANVEFQGIKKEIADKEAAIQEIPKAGNSELLARKQTIQSDIESLNNELSTRDQVARMTTRRGELEAQEKTLAQELANQEGIEFAIKEFTKAKIDTLESRINGKFKLVRFKMFSEQINGGLAECCETLYKGVPWQDMNAAARVQCGLDIINTLSDHYKVWAPVFIDNRESTTKIPDTRSQIINLIVSPKDKKLRIESKQMEAVA